MKIEQRLCFSVDEGKASEDAELVIEYDEYSKMILLKPVSIYETNIERFARLVYAAVNDEDFAKVVYQYFGPCPYDSIEVEYEDLMMVFKKGDESDRIISFFFNTSF